MKSIADPTAARGCPPMTVSPSGPSGVPSTPLPGGASVSRQEREVVWYRANGKYPRSRITREYRGQGREYVIGDWSWNQIYPDYPEFIERAMERDVSTQMPANGRDKHLGLKP